MVFRGVGGYVVGVTVRDEAGVGRTTIISPDNNAQTSETVLKCQFQPTLYCTHP
jgi:hypothetical protein